MTVFNELKDFLIESKWTKYTSARNRYWKSVAFDSKNAYRFCLSGALAKLSEPNEININLINLDRLIRKYTKYQTALGFNDNSCFDEIKEFMMKIQDEQIISLTTSIEEHETK